MIENTETIHPNGERRTTRTHRIARKLIWLFYPKDVRLEGEENLPKEPCIIVGNHAHIHGPVCADFFLPENEVTWCASEMMDRKLVPEYAYQDFWSGKPAGIRWFYKILSRLIAPLSEHILLYARTIPVYRDKRILKTVDLTVQHLQQGDYVVIFPEQYAPYNNIVHQFQLGFTSVAARYYKRTGQRLAFVPMYVCPALKKLVFGPPVVYDPEEPYRKEQQRICNALMDGISELAYCQPRHHVVPYPNVSKKDYPENIRPAFAHDEMEGSNAHENEKKMG